MRNRWTSRTAVLGLIVLAMAGAALVDTTSDAEILAGNYMWITRAADDPGHAACEAQNAGSECVELCMQATSGIITTGMVCCLEPWKVGGWDHPDECEHWAH